MRILRTEHTFIHIILRSIYISTTAFQSPHKFADLHLSVIFLMNTVTQMTVQYQQKNYSVWML